MKRRILNLLIAIDQLAWVALTLGNGLPDETISAALWRTEQQGKVFGRFFRPLIDTLFWFDPDHCKSAYNSELRKLQLPGSYRG